MADPREGSLSRSFTVGGTPPHYRVSLTDASDPAIGLLRIAGPFNRQTEFRLSGDVPGAGRPFGGTESTL